MIGRPEPYQPAIRPWMRATSSSERRRLPRALGVALQDDLQAGQQHDGQQAGADVPLPAAEADDGRSGKTASSRMQEMPLARKLRAAKPQVRRASRYCASELSFQPDCGSAKPERTHSRTSSRLMWAVGTRRRSAQ